VAARPAAAKSRWAFGLSPWYAFAPGRAQGRHGSSDCHAPPAWAKPERPFKPSVFRREAVLREKVWSMPARHLLALIVCLCCASGHSAGRAFAEDPVLVNITGPLAAKLGERISFEVELVNRSGRTLEKLRVVDYFDKGFHHEASASPIEQKGTIDLAAGTARRITLDFLTDEPGRQCHRVEILDQAHRYMGGATECVLVSAPVAPPMATAAPQGALPPSVVQPPMAVPPAAFAGPPPVSVPPAAVVIPPVAPAPAFPLSPTPVPSPQPMVATAVAPQAVPSLALGMSGPNELTVGGMGEFVATVRNTGLAPSGPTKLEFNWDDSYAPLEASDGYKLGPSSVSWALPSIEAGGQLRRQINLRSQAPSGLRGGQSTRACVRGVLSEQAGGVMVADESCVLIKSNAPSKRTPREAGLRVSVADCDDPVQAGGATTLVCTVSNGGVSPSGRLDVVVILPEQGRLVGDPTPSRVRIEGPNVTFDPLASLPPGGHAVFELTYRLPVGGVGKATAIVSGAEIDGSMESSCATTFLVP